MTPKNDIVIYTYAPPPNSVLDGTGRVLSEVLAARRRGIIFDFGNGVNQGAGAPGSGQGGDAAECICCERFAIEALPILVKRSAAPQNCL